MLKYSVIRQAAALNGLELVGSVDLSGLISKLSQHRRPLEQWQESGYAGQMEWMNRQAELFTNPQNLFLNARSVVSFIVPYVAAVDPADTAPCPPGFGRIARYARGRDYHRVLKKRLKLTAEEICRRSSSGLNWRAFSDAVPFLERAAAVASGLGFTGKNTMVIRPGTGSYFFLAELLLDQEIEYDEPQSLARQSGCGTCSRCQTDCPTSAFESPGRLDARRCISYLTIEKTGEFTDSERRMVGDWAFGCDRCQEVCPFNHTGVAAKKVLEPFDPKQGAGALIDLASIFSISNDTEFLSRFAGTPLMRPGRENLIRNCLAVAANQVCSSLAPAIVQLINRESSQLIRNEAKAALRHMLDDVALEDLSIVRNALNR